MHLFGQKQYRLYSIYIYLRKINLYSVSDIVVIQDKRNISSHYCDTVGFSEIAFLEKDRASLQMKNIEDVVEQNDNNFDGIINNTPSMSELEKKVRQGESASLTDMCKAIRNEREKPEIKGFRPCSKDKGFRGELHSRVSLKSPERLLCEIRFSKTLQPVRLTDNQAFADTVQA